MTDDLGAAHWSHRDLVSLGHAKGPVRPPPRPHHPLTRQTGSHDFSTLLHVLTSIISFSLSLFYLHLPKLFPVNVAAIFDISLPPARASRSSEPLFVTSASVLTNLDWEQDIGQHTKQDVRTEA